MFWLCFAGRDTSRWKFKSTVRAGSFTSLEVSKPPLLSFPENDLEYEPEEIFLFMGRVCSSGLQRVSSSF